MPLFQGLSAFPITPTDSAGRVNTENLGLLLERIAGTDASSVGLLGSTGGYAYLTREERRRAIEAASEYLKRRTPLIASVGAIRTDEAQALAKDAQSAGADGLLMAPVSYTPLTQEEAYQHYVAVAGETDLQLCIYNNPSTTHFTFTAELIEQLSQVPNITGIKMPLPKDGDYASELMLLRDRTTEGFSIAYSGDWGCAAGVLAGADGWHSAVGGLFPAETMKLFKAARGGNADEVALITTFFQPLFNLCQEFGSLRVLYAAANILSLTDAQPHRPLLPFSSEDQMRVSSAVSELTRLDVGQH